MKRKSVIQCDICGEEIEPRYTRSRYVIRGKRYVRRLFYPPEPGITFDGWYFKKEKERFDMCEMCMMEFRKFIKEKRDRD